MTTIVYRKRASERHAAERELESWQGDSVAEVEELVLSLLEDRDSDKELFGRILKDTRGRSRAEIDLGNRFIQDICDTSLRILDLAWRCIRMLRNEGHEVQGADRLEQATEDYRRWKEEYPELFVMTYEPVRQVIADRIRAALSSQAQESNWQQLFADDIDDADGE